MQHTISTILTYGIIKKLDLILDKSSNTYRNVICIEILGNSDDDAHYYKTNAYDVPNIYKLTFPASVFNKFIQDKSGHIETFHGYLSNNTNIARNFIGYLIEQSRNNVDIELVYINNKNSL